MTRCLEGMFFEIILDTLLAEKTDFDIWRTTIDAVSRIGVDQAVKDLIGRQ